MNSTVSRAQPSAAKCGWQRSHELADRCNLTALGNEREGGGTDCSCFGTWRCGETRVDHGAFVDQPEERRPRRHVKNCDDVQRMTRAPRRSVLRMSRHVDA